jgi:hypothetical protein
MKLRATTLTLALLGCSDPATSALRGDAGRDVTATDANAPDGNTPDANTRDASAPDASAPDANTRDASAPDATAPDASTPDGSAGAPRVVQLGGAFVGSGTQGRLDALYAVLGVTAERLAPGEVTAARLEGAVIVAAFASPPTDWTAARSQPVLDAVRAGAWMLGEAYGPWPLHEAGALSVSELSWSRTEPCVGSFFWLNPAAGEASYFAFAGIEAWTPTSEITPQMGPVVISYPVRAAGMTIPIFNAMLPATRARHGYLQYVQSYCEPDVSRHPWCAENLRFCNGERGVNDASVDEFTVGAGRVFNVTTASHNTASLQWGDVTTRMQANIVREGLRRLAR